MKLICKQCGKDFESDRSNKKYCSKICYTIFQKGKPHMANVVGKRGIKPRKRTISKCLICGKDFEHHLYRKAKYCSKECWNKRNPKIIKDCLYCGKEYWSYNSQDKTYCSDKCRGLHLRELKIGSNSPFWKGGTTKQNKLDRTRTIYKEWRNGVFIKDNYTCKDCGIKNGNGKKIYLQAHHIKGFADYPNSRYDIENGITLCKDCHLLRHTHKF